MLCEVWPSGNLQLSSCRRWAGVIVSMKANRAGMSTGSSFIDGRVIVDKLSWVGHRWSAACIGMEINGQRSSERDCCMDLGGQILVVLAIVLCVGECGCVKDWAWLTVVLSSLSWTAVQNGAIMSVAEVVTEELVG